MHRWHVDNSGHSFDLFKLDEIIFCFNLLAEFLSIQNYIN